MIQFVLGYGHAEFTRLCIESIYKHTPPREIHLVVWENRSRNELSIADINPENTVLLKMDKNYGCATALNAMVKSFGLEFDQDVMYLSNDHYVFPNWIGPLLENRHGFDAVSPMTPYGLPDVHRQLSPFLDFKENLRREYLDHPESRARIREFLHLIYGQELETFLCKHIAGRPEVCLTDQLWAGCFWLNRRILQEVSLFRTDRGLACDEDSIWIDANLRGKRRMGVCGHCYVHHFQSITTLRNHLSMDHEVDEFARRPVPMMTDYAQAVVREGVKGMSSVLQGK